MLILLAKTLLPDLRVDPHENWTGHRPTTLASRGTILPI